MKKVLNLLLIFIFIFDKSIGQASQDPNINFLYIARYDNCEGKDSSNYTTVSQFKRDRTCSIESSLAIGNLVIISTDSNGNKSTNFLNILAISLYDAGAYTQVEAIVIGTSGPLQGKYLYEKTIQLSLSYMKKCSSVLGYSFVTTKSGVLIISDKLDPKVFIVPTGAFEEFKKSATTICKGGAHIF